MEARSLCLNSHPIYQILLWFTGSLWTRVFVLAFLLFLPTEPAAMEPSEEAKSLHTRLQQLRLELIGLKKQLQQALEYSDNTSSQVDTYVEVVGHTQGLTNFYTSPRLISLLLDDQKVLDHQYTDVERMALEEGGTQRLYSTDLEQGDHVLAVSYGGIEKNGKKYLKVLPIYFHKGQLRMRVILRLQKDTEGPRLDYTLWQGSAQSVPPRHENFLIRRARYDIRLNQHLSAAVLALSLLDSQQSSIPRDELLFDLARTYFFLQLPGQATSLFLELTQKPIEQSKRAEAWFYLEKIHYQEKHFEEALQAFNQITVDLPPPLWSESMYLAGNSYLHLKLFDQAELIHQKIPRLSEFYPYALYAIALAELHKEERVQATSILQKIKTITNRDDIALQRLKNQAHQLLGYLYLEQGQPQKAKSEFATVPVKYQASVRTLYGRGWTALDLGDFSGALQVFSDLATRSPRNPYGKEAYLATGYIYSKLQLFNQAVEQYQSALKIYTQSLEEVEQQMEALLERQGDEQSREIIPTALNFDQTKKVLQQIAAQADQGNQVDDNSSPLLEQYQQLLLLERAVLLDKDRLPKGEYGLLVRQIYKAQDHIAALRQNLTGYLAKSLIQMLEQQMWYLDDLAVRACLGIADQLAILMTGPTGEEMLLGE